MHEQRALPVLAGLLRSVGFEDAPLDRLEIVDDGLALATDWPVTANAVAAIAAVGLAASAIEERRSGRRTPVRIGTRAAGLAMASSTYLSIDGRNAKFRDPFTGFYRAADRPVFLHGNFPHLRDGLVRILGADDAQGVGAAVARLDAFEIERRAIEAGVCAAAVRTPAEWRAEPQRAAVRALPVVEIEPLGEEAPAFDPGPGEAPLGGVRVLDFSRVIAGPMAGRSLAENGAEVLLVSGPGLPSITSLVVDTGFGKRSAEIDLRSDGGRAALDTLLRRADIVLDAYRPGALAGLGYGREQLAALRPGLVHVDLDAFGRAGPWRGRRGYDSLVQATAGMCWEGGEAEPTNLPCQPLDYLSGYLAAFGALVALLRRSDTSRGSSVRLSLARTAEWMWETREALGPEAAPPASSPTAAEAAGILDDYQTAFGSVTAMRPPLREAGWRWPRGPVPLGSDPARWMD